MARLSHVGVRAGRPAAAPRETGGGSIRSAMRHLKRRLIDSGMSDLAVAIHGENHHYVLLLDAIH